MSDLISIVLAVLAMAGFSTSATATEPAVRLTQTQIIQPPVDPPPPSINIPAIGIDSPLVFGKQRAIDNGHIVLPQWAGISDLNGGTYNNSCLPSWGCTVWVAAHRTTHGSAFIRLDDLVVGDVVNITDGGTVYSYTITGGIITPRTDTPVSVISGDLVLQASWTNGNVLLKFGTLT